MGNEIKIGDKVKMSEGFKKRAMINSQEHINEFGDCEGYTEEWEISDFDVRWEPSGLRYAYDSEDLVKVVDMNRTSEEILKPYVEIPFTHTKIVEKDNALKAMDEFGEQEAARRERIAYRKGLTEGYDGLFPEVKELEVKLKKFEDEINQRIAHLKDVDADFCKDRWDITKPQMERNIYREMSNQVTATRQELEMIMRTLSLPCEKVEADQSVREIAAKTYKTDMAAFAEGCGQPFNALAWHIYKRAFDIASYSLKLKSKSAGEFIICSAVRWQNTTICGRRHADCYAIADALMNGGFLERERKHQGFMTSIGRFVDRVEAFKIAKANSQIVHAMFDNDKEGSLTSEDLYGVDE